MKNRILLVLWMISICICTNGQNITGLYFTDEFSTKLAGIEKKEQQIFPGTFSTQKINDDSLKTSLYDNSYYLQKSRSQSINGLMLMAGGSVISAVGIRYGISGSYDAMNNDSHSAENKYDKVSCSGLALTGLVMMAGSIPYFISALKNRNKAGLKLTSQKTIFGSSVKACKRVTSLTYSIPIGK